LFVIGKIAQMDHDVENLNLNPTDRMAMALAKVQAASIQLQDLLRHPGLSTVLSSDLISRRRRVVRVMISVCEMRDQHLGSALFVDPAWNILLDAYASDLDGRRISVSDACIAARAPYSTALRWLKALTERGLVWRQDDPADKRRAYIGLTDHARTVVEGLVDEVIKVTSTQID
jgi:hypothetical protein